MKSIKNKITKIIGTLAVIAMAFCAIALPGDKASAAEPTCVFDESGTKICDIDMSGFAYGKFTVKAVGQGASGLYDSDIVTFYYYPAYAELVEENGKYYVDVYYNWDNGSEEPSGDVSSAIIKVYYPNSDNEVPFSPINVELNASGVSRVELPFEEYGLNDGDYRIEVYAYDRDGELLCIPYTFFVNYQTTPIPVPDTGGILQNTNISQTDYLITGLIVFGIVAVAGVIYMTKGNRRRK